MQNFKTLASLCSWAGRFESYLVAKSRKTGFLMTWLNYLDVLLHWQHDKIHLQRYLSHCTTKPTKWPVHPAKTQISLGIHPVWLETSLCNLWTAKNQTFLHADREDSDQTGRMPRLIWVFAGRIGQFAGFVVLLLILVGSEQNSENGICIQQRLRSACTSGHSNQTVFWELCG